MVRFVGALVAVAGVCGCAGGQGNTGPAGPSGMNGSNGANGKTSLVRLVPEAAGTNCPAGGTSVQAGVDTNDNGTLDSGEVSQTQYVCAGESGQASPGTLVSLRPEPAGANCANAGTAVLTGPDTNRNGALDPVEVTQTRYVCNGSNGQGTPALVATTTEPSGARCLAGGVLVQSGLDTNQNGTLDGAEVTSTSAVCNGTAGDAGTLGNPALARTVPEPSGANCSTGGVAVQAGADSNRNGTLESAEVTSTSYVCNGATGAAGTTGASGRASLVRLDSEPAGTNCPATGTAVRSGADTNGNGVLDSAEVTSTSYVCSGTPGPSGDAGVNGLNSLVRVDSELAGANCTFGGSAVRVGLDGNRNQVLDSPEVTQTTYFCSTPGPYFVNWGASAGNQPDTGELGNNLTPLGKVVPFFKVRNDTRLKITVTDNLRVGWNGAQGGSGVYMVRVNGSVTNCYSTAYVANSSVGVFNFHAPHADTCILELPAGYYLVEAYAGYANNGTMYVGWSSEDDLVLVEELTDPRYVFATSPSQAGNSTTTLSPAPGRTVSYTKQSSSTWLKVTLADTLRGTTTNGEGVVELRMDGASTECSTGSSDAQANTAIAADIHTPFVLTCVLRNVPAGPHSFEVRFGRAGPQAGEALIGYGRIASTLLVEELDSTDRFIATTNTVSGDIASSMFVAVPSRTLSANITRPGLYKLTYSDTFGGGRNSSTGGCTGTYRINTSNAFNSMYSFINTGSNPPQDHHRSINQVSLWNIPAAGLFTFTVQTRSDCGTNYFGYLRGQALLLLERVQ